MLRRLRKRDLQLDARARRRLQFVDLTLANNGFAPGTFIGFGPLAGTTTTIQWNGLVAGQSTTGASAPASPASAGPSRRPVAFTPCGPDGSGRRHELRLHRQRPASVTWGIPTPPLGTIATYIDISLQDNGFLPGTFVGQNATGQQNFTWQRHPGQRPAHLAHQQPDPQGWLTAVTGTFFAASC